MRRGLPIVCLCPNTQTGFEEMSVSGKVATNLGTRIGKANIQQP